jgi:hypothetical protein
MAGLNHQAHGELDLSIGSALPRARRLGSIASFRPCANHFQVDPDNQTISEQARTSHSGQLATSPGWLNEHSVLRRETTATHPWISSLASRLILVDPRATRAPTKPSTRLPAAVMATKSPDQGWRRPPIKSKCLEPVSSRYGSSASCAC